MEKARVISVNESAGTASILMELNENCRSCGACLNAGGAPVPVEAANEAGARPGDTVKVDSLAGSRVGSSLQVFILPLAAFFGGFIGATSAGSNELVSFAAGLLVAALYFFLLRFKEKRRNPDNAPVFIIRSVVKPEDAAL
jgi:positive regulator of sigma E activity